jgi:hypothetical protein
VKWNSTSPYSVTSHYRNFLSNVLVHKVYFFCSSSSLWQFPPPEKLQCVHSHPQYVTCVSVCRATNASTLEHLYTDTYVMSIRSGPLSTVPTLFQCYRQNSGPRISYFLSRMLGANLSFTKPKKKTYVPGFSQKYFTIWGRNMDTKHTTGEQITGNWDGSLEKICEQIKERKGPKRHH